MNKISILVLIQLLTCLAYGQDTVRVATYNLLNYPGVNSAIRNPLFRTIVQTMNPDVLVVQEMLSQSGVTGFLNNVMNFSQPGAYATVPFNNGPDTDNSFYYKSSKVNFLGASYISTTLRNIAEYRFTTVSSQDTVRVYSLHLKAGQSDTQRRLDEATVLRNHLNSLPSGSRFIVAGDFNIYRSTEPAFEKLIGSEANNNGRCKDPLNSIGSWNNNFSFRFIHTQSTRTRSFDGGATGGLDDRFDMILTSSSISGSILTSTYTSYGNDGNHFNDSINRMPNTAVPDSVANALHYAADHLPVYSDFIFGMPAPVASGAEAPMKFRLSQNYPNPFNPSTTIEFSLPRSGYVRLKVFNVLGEVVARLINEELDVGTYTTQWNASGVASAVYFYQPCRIFV